MSDDEPVELGENGKFKIIEEKSEQAYWLDLTDLSLESRLWTKITLVRQSTTSSQGQFTFVRISLVSVGLSSRLKDSVY